MLNKDQKIYMIGIKGVGMTMLAQFLFNKGFNILGSDVVDQFQTEKTLQRQSIKYYNGFSLKNIPSDIDLVIRSSAFSVESNIELKHFKKNKIKIITYAEAVASLFDLYFGVSVCGSHGKTTVTSWLGYVLLKSAFKPNVLSGSYVPQFKGSSLIGDSKYLLVESDEYQNKLQYFNPKAVILNNIDFDHPDYFKNNAEYVKVFADFVKKIPANGFLIVNADDKEAKKMSKKNKGDNIFYSLNPELSIDASSIIYYAKNITSSKIGQSFDLYKNKRKLASIDIPLMGNHNVYNALAVIASSLKLGLSLDQIRSHIKTFKGASRRFDILGKYNDAIIIDDYAHHPSEIKAVLEATLQKYPNKEIITFFHPHTVSRTKALLKDFASSFSLSHKLFILEIYSSARERESSFKSIKLINEIEKYNKEHSIKQDLAYLKDLKDLEKKIKLLSSKNRIILLLGAGDIFRAAYNILQIKTGEY